MTCDLAIDRVIENEGRFSNDPHDPGGITRYGFTKRYHPAEFERIVDEDSARVVMRERWEAGPYGKLHPKIAVKLFDVAFPLGLERASVALQRAIHATTKEELKEDGVVGPITIAASERAHCVDALLAAFRSECAGIFRLIVETTSHGRRFRRGWMKRAYQ